MKPWSPDPSRQSCICHYGNIRQLCGLTRYELLDGKAKGVEAVDVETGGGLYFTVLPGRGMDISVMRYRGIPIAYLSKADVAAPGYHDPRENQWLKSFFAGMLTTCGLTNAGPACRDGIGLLDDVPFGLHGDISNTGADNVCVREEWVQGHYRMEVSGRVQEGRLHGEHLSLRRKVTAYLGEKRFMISDVFENLGELPQALMFFYHINIGHPVLSPGARFEAPSARVWAETGEARIGLDRYDQCDAPRSGFLEQQFFHEMRPDSEGRALVALINDDLELAVYLRYFVRELPCFAQWKVMRDAEYVLAFEPGNCHPVGRDRQKALGMETLPPMESRTGRFEIRIAEGLEEIPSLREEICSRR